MTRQPPDDATPVPDPERIHEAIHEHRDDPDKVAAVIEKALQDPAAEELYFVADLLADLAEIYSQAGRHDEAIATHERAMEAGYTATPDPRMDLGRFLARAGRLEEMRQVHEDVAGNDPDDVWFHNSAGLDEVEVGDHERAVRHFGNGIELCIARHDPERVIDQLVGLRAASLDALGRPPDELQERGERLMATLEYDGPLAVDPGDFRGPAGATAATVAWFPAPEFAAALERWPRLAERVGTDDYRAYARRVQGHLIDTRRALGRRPGLAPIAVNELLDYADRAGFDPALPRTRRAWAAEITERGGALEWPPGRNDPCWCGSGSKHKRCCDGVSPRPEHRSVKPAEGERLPVYYEIEVTLVGPEPPVWRRFQLPATATFLELHEAIQIACGWEFAHLFGFADVAGRSFAPAPSERRSPAPLPTAERLHLGAYFSVHDRCDYVYDFGDRWKHEVVLRRRTSADEPFERRLIGGRRAFPPEDSGGLPGYRDCVAAATDDGASPESREWLGEWHPEAFDLEGVRARFDR